MRRPGRPPRRGGPPLQPQPRRRDEQEPLPVRQHRPGANTRAGTATRPTRGAPHTIGARGPAPVPRGIRHVRIRSARRWPPTTSSRPTPRGRGAAASAPSTGSPLEVAGRHRVRPARPERRRQVDHRQDPHHAVAAGLRQRARSPASTCSPRRTPSGTRSGSSRRSRRAIRWPPAGENLELAGRIQGLSRADARARAARAARPVRPRRRRRPARQDLVGRDGPQARRRDRARAPPAGALPRRADHRSRPARPARRCGPRSRACPPASRSPCC